uniref:Choline transporter-like protein n=1 Tax=Alexandrium catenella TaxID=2925 RepID=A0A7S1LT05_ALECA
MHRRLEFSAVGWLTVLSWVFGIVWVMETMNGMGQFAISHAVVSFANPTEQDAMRGCFPVVRGYLVGIWYHLGSIAFGGFVLGVLKILAAVLTFLARQARDEAGVRGAIAGAVCCCCAQCALVVEQALSMVNDLVYTDIALQGSRYMEAAQNVVRVAASNPAEYALLKGSAMAVRVMGVLAITGASTLLAFQGLASQSLHHVLERRVSPEAAELLETPSLQGTTVAVAIVSFQISMTFMTVFYQTTHTLTYCMLIGAATVGTTSPRSARKGSLLLAGHEDV